jgi:hypothetical protein
VPFWLGVTLLEHGEWLSTDGKASEARPMLEEARGIFERLHARPWLERLARTVGSQPEPLAVELAL